MNREQYIAKRNALMAEAKAYLDAGDVEKFNGKKGEIEQLDADYENNARAQADFAALSRPDGMVNIGAALAIQTNGIVASSGAAEPEEKEPAAYRRAFYNMLTGREMSAEERSAYEMVNLITAADNEVAIPTTVVSRIWSEMGEMHPIIADTAASRTSVSGNLTIIVGTDENDAEWYDEDKPVNDGDVALATIELHGCELAKAVTISWKMREMAMDDFENFLVGKISEKMSSALAAGIIEGNGTREGYKSEPQGIVKALEAEASTPQVITYTDGDLKYENLTSALAVIKSAYVRGAAIYCKNSVIWSVLANIMDASGRPIFVPDVTSGGVGRIFGITVKEEDAVEDGEILIGNASAGYVSNVNRDIGIVTEDHAKARSTDFVGYMIIDGKVKTTKAFAVLRPQ